MGYVGVPPQSGFITTAKQRVTSSTNNYVDLDHSISSLADVIIWVNFVKQDSTNLTLTTSSRITLGATLVASDIVEIAYLGKAVATQNPSTNSVTNDMLSGSIANSKLANSSITLNGSAVSLGGSATLSSTMTPSFHAYGTSGFQAIANATNTVVNVSNEKFDSDNAFSTSTKRFTPQTAGKYFLYGNIARDGNWSAYARLFLALNGNTSGSETLFNTTDDSGGNGGVHVSGIIDMNGSSDYVELIVRQDSGGSLNLWNSGLINFFGGFRVLL